MEHSIVRLHNSINIYTSPIPCIGRCDMCGRMSDDSEDVAPTGRSLLQVNISSEGRVSAASTHNLVYFCDCIVLRPAHLSFRRNRGSYFAGYGTTCNHIPVFTIDYPGTDYPVLSINPPSQRSGSRTHHIAQCRRGRCARGFAASHYCWVPRISCNRMDDVSRCYCLVT